MSFPVDVVILWVDGSDPVLNAKRRSWAPPESLSDDNSAGATRYADCGEIHWCVRSIREYAPWVRKIFIVTDGQDPCLESGTVPVEIIDHKDIFTGGLEDYLPVFSATAIESVIWRIPGLSDHFIYFNDDFFLTKPVQKEDFFYGEDGVVCYAKKYSVPLAAILRKLRHDPEHKHFSFRGMMLNTAQLIGERKFFYRYNHTPRGLIRSFYEEIYKEHSEWLYINIGSRFRSPRQFSMEELLYIYFKRAGKLKVLPYKGNLFFVQWRNDREYFKEKYNLLLQTDYKFAGFNSMDKLTGEERDKLFEWLKSKLAY